MAYIKLMANPPVVEIIRNGFCVIKMVVARVGRNPDIRSFLGR